MGTFPPGRALEPVGLHLEVTSDLQSLVTEWESLWRACQHATPFQSPQWLLPWWKQFGSGSPLAVCARRGSELVGLGLFYLQGPETDSQMLLIGAGVSDYQDLLTRPKGDEVVVAEAIISHAAGLAPPASRFVLSRLPQASAILRRSGLSPFVDGLCPVLPLDRGAGPVPPSHIKWLRYCRRRAERLGRVEFTTATEHDALALLPELVRLHQARWQAAGKPGVFADPKMQRFLEEAAVGLQCAGMLRFHAMRLDGELISVALCMHHAHRTFLYLPAFDLRFAALSPGAQIIFHAVEHAAAEGALEFDFLQGDEPYKTKQWGAQPRPTYRLEVSGRRSALAA